MKTHAENGRTAKVLGRFCRRPPFHLLNASQIEWLHQHSKSRCHETGGYPIKQDCIFSRIEMIVRGTADLVTYDNLRREVAFRRLFPGDLYGFTALFCEGLALYSVRAATDLEVLSLARTDFERVIRRNAAVRDYFLKEAMVRIRQAYLKARGPEARVPRLPDTCAGVTARLEKPLAHIQANYEKPLTLEAVAAVGGMSPYYFSRLFKSLLGYSFKEYLNHCRIEAAKDMLQRKDVNVAEVCYAVGYNDHSYFTRIFKKITSQTPSEYRCSLDSLRRFPHPLVNRGRKGDVPQVKPALPSGAGIAHFTAYRKKIIKFGK